ncbi:hypothetical protein HBH39_16695 [Shewanella aestuarii]|uniref:DUF3108 domain-containing protein n=1 Tax=Shewanella aestuarii TaxID=1028752 RepID=A0A6G9QR52_9GAMM|nr:hypothetical protein HBH39_16695 [Shewanella aestuarii]
MVVTSFNVQANDEQFQCSRQFNYSIYLSGIHTGNMTRSEHWQHDTGVINSHSQASILGIGTEYQQRAQLSRSKLSNEWLTQSFHQQVSGFRSRNMQVTFSEDGLQSKVDLDGKINTYLSEQIPLRDVDTLTVQLREYVLQGRKQFILIRQASDAIEPYQFYVQDVQTRKIDPWGELQLIPIKQTGAEKVTYYFAPSLDYQLVQARYHGILLQGLIELDSYSSTCHSPSVYSVF